MSHPNHALWDASKAGDFSSAWNALSCGADPNHTDPDYSWTPLHICAREGHLSICKLLISKGAFIDAKDRSGQTPLHRAAFWGKFHVVQYFVLVGADLNLPDYTSQLPEELAFYQNHLQIYRYITQAKAEAKRKESERAEEAKKIKSYLRQLEKDQRKLEAIENKLSKKEAELREKIDDLGYQLERLKVIPEAELTKKQRHQMDKLQAELSKLRSKANQMEMQIREARSTSFERFGHIDDRGTAWIDFINGTGRGSSSASSSSSILSSSSSSSCSSRPRHSASAELQRPSGLGPSHAAERRMSKSFADVRLSRLGL